MNPKTHEDKLFRLIQPLLLCFDPETLHEHTLSVLQYTTQLRGVSNLLQRFYGFEHPCLQTHLWGKTFPNPIGMAAGFDKNGLVFNPLFALGFGFVEVGTITPLAQSGNPKPRLFRLPKDQALINRLGFNNLGVDSLAKQIPANPPQGILGINIGKNKETPIEHAKGDYGVALKKIYDHADYIVINVSSPNTEQLRTLQEKETLRILIKCLLAIRQTLVQQGKPQKPLLLKMAPDLTDETFHAIVSTIEEFSIDGIIATNTTLKRTSLKNTPTAQEVGGLSGMPLRSVATRWIGQLYQTFEKAIPIIGTGGIFTGKDAYEKIRAGASLVQIYTSLIYRGPASVKYIKQELLELLMNDGFTSVSEAVGADFR